MNKLSIITINYNDKKGLIKTFETVKNQTCNEFEYIVIDGGSTDGSFDEIELNKSFINYSISEPDKGIYNAMNKGIHAAKGDYLLFLNSGDTLFSNKTIENVIKKLDGTRDVFYGNAIFINDLVEEIVTYPEKLTFHFFTYNSLCHQATFIKKSLFESTFYYNEDLKIIADWEFIIYSICIKNCSYKHIDEFICYYDFEGISSNSNSKEAIQKETDLVMKKYFSAFIDDYKNLEDVVSKRVRNILYIKQFPLAWKILKGVSNIILLFLPKKI